MLGAWAAVLGAIGLVLVIATERRRADEGEEEGPVSYQGTVKFGGRLRAVLAEWWEALCDLWQKFCSLVSDLCPRCAEAVQRGCEKLRAGCSEMWAVLSDWWQRFYSWMQSLCERARTSQSYSRLMDLTGSCHVDDLQGGFHQRVEWVRECASPLQACEWQRPGHQEVIAVPAHATAKLPEELPPPLCSPCTIYRAPRNSPFRSRDPHGDQTILPGMQRSPYNDEHTLLPNQQPRVWSFNQFQPSPTRDTTRRDMRRGLPSFEL